jgi:3-deoxy-D-manno-octulosonic-acid transferase
LPWDTAGNAAKFISISNPTVAIFVKYEFWFHYSRVLHARHVPLLSICSIFRPEQTFFKPYGGFYRGILKCFSYFFVQNEASLTLLHSIGIQNCELAGDTRFDRVHHIVRQAEEIAVVKRFKADQKTMVVGSCWPEDLDVLVPFINEKKLKFIIAPHEITESFLKFLEGALHVKSIRFSKVNEHEVEQFQVLIIDNIGMLSRLYRYGEFAYVGGAFGKGLHNILEAACYGIPIIFGNRNYQKFREAVDLISQGGAFAIGNYAELKATIEMLNVPANFLLACDVSRSYVLENLGATEKIMGYCRKLLK